MSTFSINEKGVSGKNWHKGLFLLWISILTSCQNPPSSQVRIQTIMDKQESAWNRGDVEGFMNGYLKSDSLCFIGRKGLNFGWQTTLDNYRDSYPDREAMGKLEFNNMEYKPLCPDYTFVIGQWTLFRETDTIGGHYSLLWQKTEKGWKIIADHSS